MSKTFYIKTRCFITAGGTLIAREGEILAAKCMLWHGHGSHAAIEVGNLRYYLSDDEWTYASPLELLAMVAE